MKTCTRIMSVAKFGPLVWLISKTGTMYLVLKENVERGYYGNIISFIDVKGVKYCVL